MGLVFYADSGFTQRIRMVLGSLSDSGSSFAVSAEPDEVRKYNTSSPNGDLLTKNTSTPTSPGTGEWGYSSGTVYLGDALASGDTAVAFTAGTRVLEDVNTLSGKAKFATNTTNADDRIKRQQLFLKNTETTKQYTNVSILLADLVSGAGSDVGRYGFAPDNSGSMGTLVGSVGSLSDTGSSFTVSAQPVSVIKKTASAPNGFLLTENTSTPTTPNAGEWGYSGGTVYLGDALASGESVTAYTSATLTSSDISGLATMAPGDSVTFWVQCTVPENDPVANLRDIEIKATSTEEATN
ncbi:hypothetical protein [Mesoaciditoga lauensis]|uniref:hypothetical protein n=1 Tax=Mesoaciditoga lauensis TaxID=1495039 RepID=UPI000560C700|nr:hypothetical protein [Mesoaciditoga lauensis]